MTWNTSPAALRVKSFVITDPQRLGEQVSDALQHMTQPGVPLAILDINLLKLDTASDILVTVFYNEAVVR